LSRSIFRKHFDKHKTFDYFSSWCSVFGYVAIARGVGSNAKVELKKSSSDRTLALDILNKNNMSARFRLEENILIFKVLRMSVLLRYLVEGTLYLTMATKT